MVLKLTMRGPKVVVIYIQLVEIALKVVTFFFKIVIVVLKVVMISLQGCKLLFLSDAHF